MCRGSSRRKLEFEGNYENGHLNQTLENTLEDLLVDHFKDVVGSKCSGLNRIFGATSPSFPVIFLIRPGLNGLCVAVIISPVVYVEENHSMEDFLMWIIQ